MSLVFVRTFLSIALLSLYGSTVPLDYIDPQTWFQADELMGSPNQTDSSSALQVAASPSVIPTNGPTTSPPLQPVSTTTAIIYPTIKTTVVPVTKIPTTFSSVMKIPKIVSPVTKTPTAAVSPAALLNYTSTLRTIVNVTEPTVTASMIPTSTSTLSPQDRPATVLTSTSTLQTIVNVTEPNVTASMIPTSTSILSPQDRFTVVSSPNSAVPTSTSIASPQDKSSVISSANSVVVQCSPNPGTASASVVTGNERTSAVVQPEATFTTGAPIQIRSSPLPLRRITTQLPMIVVRNWGSNRKRPNNQNINRRNRVSCDMCTSYCSENRRICARPEGVNDPDQLRGFPSVCHMDCFNVCRKIRYEKVADGRCGRLRDGVRPLGSKKKLTRIELNKAQYEIEDGDDPIFVLSPLN